MSIKKEENLELEELIEVKNVSKKYRLYNRKRDRIKQKLRRNRENIYNEKIAVEDISFKIKRGETIGIVGKNGSGKSTLLQMICGTVNPTSGEISSRGKIAALLELGSGFNPEFTGRENVYLNGMLLGLTQKEIREKMERIIEFSEIDEFIDQPVKTYSSGMIVRLAFSVIVNVDADILIIDEALAVGDAFFRQKCMRFLRRFKKNGSLLFVSHDASAIMSICDRAILLEKGKIKIEGSPKRVIEEYTKNIQTEENLNSEMETGENKAELQGNNSYANEEWKWKDYRNEAINKSNMRNNICIEHFDKEIANKESYGNKEGEIINVRIKTNGEEREVITGGEIVYLSIDILAHKDIDDLIIGFILKNEMGLTLLGDNTVNCMNSKRIQTIKAFEKVRTRFVFTLPLLPKGMYTICAAAAKGKLDSHSIVHWLNEALVLRSECTSIGAGLAGIPMHTIEMRNYD